MRAADIVLVAQDVMDVLAVLVTVVLAAQVVLLTVGEIVAEVLVLQVVLLDVLMVVQDVVANVKEDVVLDALDAEEAVMVAEVAETNVELLAKVALLLVEETVLDVTVAKAVQDVAQAVHQVVVDVVDVVLDVLVVMTIVTVVMDVADVDQVAQGLAQTDAIVVLDVLAHVLEDVQVHVQVHVLEVVLDALAHVLEDVIVVQAHVQQLVQEQQQALNNIKKEVITC